jgi:hypothetical protein
MDHIQAYAFMQHCFIVVLSTIIKQLKFCILIDLDLKVEAPVININYYFFSGGAIKDEFTKFMEHFKIEKIAFTFIFGDIEKKHIN